MELTGQSLVGHAALRTVSSSRGCHRARRRAAEYDGGQRAAPVGRRGDPSAVRGPHAVELKLPLHPLLFLQVEPIPITRGLRGGWLRRLCPVPERDRARAENESRGDDEARDQLTRQVASRIEATMLRSTGLAPVRIVRPHHECLPLLRAGSTPREGHDATGTRARVAGSSRPGSGTLTQGPL